MSPANVVKNTVKSLVKDLVDSNVSLLYQVHRSLHRK